MLQYLPEPTGTGDNKRLPEREFFYKVLFKLHPQTVETMIKEADSARAPPKQNLQEQ